MIKAIIPRSVGLNARAKITPARKFAPTMMISDENVKKTLRINKLHAILEYGQGAKLYYWLRQIKLVKDG